MAKQRRYYERGMVDGNTARRLQAVPVRREADVKPVRRAKPGAKKQRRKMDVVTCLILAVSICVSVYICMSYVRAQSEITTLSKEIVTLEKTAADLKKQNDVVLESVESSIDLDEIYKIATKELGMVHADKNQVNTYEQKKSDRVRQYADIPSQ